MNPWLAALLGIIFGAILIEGVARFKERRGRATLESERARKLAEFDDFDIDYNYVAMPPPYPDLPPITSILRPQSFVQHPDPKAVSLGLVDDDFFDRNKKAFEEETKLALGITREARGYGIMAGQCNNLNADENYPYYCVRHKSHINHVDPKIRRHGYAGVFWD